MARLALFGRSRIADSAHKLYGAAVEQARRPEFYERQGVPDTVMGRFEMIALHVFLLLYRLKGEKGDGARLAQALFDVMFADMDQTLREMGTGDLSVGRRVRALAEGFYGRIAAYDAGLQAGNGELAGALQRNVFARADHLPPEGPARPGGDAKAGDRSGIATPDAQAQAMAAYVRREAESLARQRLADLLAGRARFAPPPAPP